VLVVNLVSRWEGVQTSNRWWLISGRALVLIVFGLFSALSLWLYWRGVGQVLENEEDDEL
jgi:hypothetical protein